MKVKDLVSDLKEKDCYNEFIEKYPEAFIYSVYYVLEEGKASIDFFIPSEKKIVEFALPFEEYKIHKDKIEGVEKLDFDLNVDLDDLKERVEEIKEEKEIKSNVTKIIAILQKGIWNLTCLTSDLGVLRIKINSKSGDLKEFNKDSLMNMTRVVSGRKN